MIQRIREPHRSPSEKTLKAIDEVIAERRRQVEEEGWSLVHDTNHDAGELCSAGAAYALNAGCILNPHNGTPIEDPTQCGWPFDLSWWKPKDPRRDLIRAAALIIAEVDRMDYIASLPLRKTDRNGNAAA